MLVVNLAVLMLVAGLGLLAGGLNGYDSWAISSLGYLLISGIGIYLIIVAARPRFLQRYSLLDPLWEAGL